MTTWRIEVFREFRFVFFYANEGQEPMLVHARKAYGFAKFWIDPVELDYSQSMKIADLKLAEQLNDNREFRFLFD